MNWISLKEVREYYLRDCNSPPEHLIYFGKYYPQTPSFAGFLKYVRKAKTTFFIIHKNRILP